MRRTLFLAVAGATVISTMLVSGAKWLPAQDDVLSKVYGAGVHAYFAGDYYGAEEDLSAAVAGGTKDPRAFYFRALALMRLGREDEAREDMRRGAELEVNESRDHYPVAQSLERIQGRPRLMLERYREDARLLAYEESEKRRVDRYGRGSRSTGRPVQQGVGAPALPPARANTAGPRSNAIVAPQGAIPPAAGAAQPAGDLFDTAPPEERPSVQPPLTTHGAPGVVRPSGGPVLPAAPAAEAEDDPFAEPADGLVPAPATQVPALPLAEEEDPFGESPITPAPASPAATDPFGEDPAPAGSPVEAPEPAGEEDPFGEAPPVPGTSAEEDPFGAAPATEAAPTEESNPFGAAPPAATTAPVPAAAPEDDPFSEPPPVDAEPVAPPQAAAGADPFGATESPATARASGTIQSTTTSAQGAAAGKSKGPAGGIGALFRSLAKGPRDAAASAARAMPRVGGGSAQTPAVQPAGLPAAQPTVSAPSDTSADPFADDSSAPAVDTATVTDPFADPVEATSATTASPIADTEDPFASPDE